MTKHRITRAALAFILVSGGALGGGAAALAYQGHMFAARADLRAARAELAQALPDKAGHRVNAIGIVDQALGEVNAGIAAGAR